jgi:hypothetical protein
MNRERFISLVNNPGLLKAEDTPFLEELIKEFPFFQTAHLLTARCYKVTDSIHLQKQIKIAAAHITNRQVLYHLIENFQVAQPILESIALPAIEHTSEELLEPNSNAVKKTDDTNSQENLHIVGSNQELSALETIVSMTEDEVIIQSENIVAPEKKDATPQILLEQTKILENTSTSEVDLQAPTEVQSTNATTIIAAEIPMEREIKLAIAESVYLKDFQVISEENDVIDAKKEDFSKGITENSDNINIGLSNETQNVKVVANEPASTEFVTWLKKLKDSAKEEEKTILQIEDKKGEKLIEAFIEKPIQRAKPIKQEFYSPVNMAKQSVTDNDFFVTETLAKIYIKQGNFAKAIKVYQNLSLKNPEKNTFFAAQIKILKEQLHNKSGK